MATPVKRIEKEFLFKVLYDEQLPVVYLQDRVEYLLILEEPVKNEMVFSSDQLAKKLKIRTKIDLKFDYRGKVVTFTVDVNRIRDNEITCTVPEFIYKNLDRSYSRVSIPPNLEVQFTFLGDRYNLSFPKVFEYEPGDTGDFLNSIDPRNLSGLIEQMADWIKNYATGYKLVIFKDTTPESTEERIVAETGKALYIPSTLAGMPHSDPYPRKRIITEELFKRYLESTGVTLAHLDEACARFTAAKHKKGIFSDAWIPVLFQEYVIGYIHIWVNVEGKPPVDYAVIETLYQFAKVLAYSLKVNGYFENGKVKNDPFGGKVIDISASGLLFAYPHSTLSSALLPDSELTVKIITPQRNINVTAKIVRRFRDKSQGYFGCRFGNLEMEDLRFLFELIYGKPFTDFDAMFLAGQV